MANYKESNLSGASWVRCSNISISNPLIPEGGGPKASVYFQEDLVITIPGMPTTVVGNGGCAKKFIPTEVINLRNPDTGELIGTSATHIDLYIILYSLYLQTAETRDQAILEGKIQDPNSPGTWINP